MVTQPKRARVEKLVNGRKRRNGQQKITFDFVEIGRTVQHDDAAHFLEMERRCLGGFQSVQDVPCEQNRQRSTCGFFVIKTQFMKERRTGIAFPRKRLT